MNRKIISGLAIFVLVLSAFTAIPLLAQASSKPVSNSGVDVLIGFTQTPGNKEQALVRAFGGEIKHSFHIVSAIAANIPEKAKEALLNNPMVTTVELDGQVHAVDVELDNSWGVKHINSGLVHDLGNKGAGAKIAVMDSGISFSHPDLNVLGGYDFVENDSDPSDVYGHGTHVAGSACAKDNDNGTSDLGVIGVSPECDLYSVRVLDDDGYGSWSDIIAALQWAVDNNQDVANLSLGSSRDPGDTVKQAFNNAESAGLFIVAAAGNSGRPNGKGNTVIYPAKYESVVAVSATDKNDTRPSWSSHGEQVELAAPGVSVYSTWNDPTSNYDPQPVCGYDSNNEYGCYKYGSGTSMASPHVAGAAALVINTGVTDDNANGRINDEVRSILNSTAKDIGETGKDELYGYGLVDAYAAVSAVGPVDEYPSVSITNPSEGDFVSGLITVSATASDDNGVTSVDFYVDSVLLGSDTESPYEVDWDTTLEDDGNYVITAEATDTASQTSSSSVNVTVDNINDSPIADAGPDQSVTDGDDSGSESVTLDGSGSYDPDGTILSYEWYEGGSLIGSGETAVVDLAVGSHTITLIVTDDDSATDSDEVVVTVNESVGISLTVTGYKYRGLQKADLEWLGATSTYVDVYRDGSIITTTANDGFYTDDIDNRGKGTYVYQVCEDGSTTVCSNEFTITFN